MTQSDYRRVHAEAFVVDSHVDSILGVVDSVREDQAPRSLYQISTLGHFDFPRMFQAGVDLAFMAAYTSAEYKPERACHRATVLVDSILSQAESYQGGLKPVLTRADLELHHSRHDPCFIISMEGGEPFEGDIRLVHAFYRMGVRCVGLTYNERNQIGDGQAESRTKSGLTQFGVQVVEELNSLGVLIDVSHMSESTFYDVVDTSTKPVVATHSNCYAIHQHGRNLKDDQLKALADIGGVVGITFVPKFLADGEAGVEDVVKHIAHAVEVAGISHVGIGSDFDGTEHLPRGLSSVVELPNLTKELLNYGFSEKEVKAILGENHVSLLLRVLR